jgi:transcriptional regulator with XRE-family HTH domain
MGKVNKAATGGKYVMNSSKPSKAGELQHGKVHGAKGRCGSSKSMNNKTVPLETVKQQLGKNPLGSPIEGLEALRREVHRDLPGAEQAYFDSRQRAELGAGLKLQRRKANLTLSELAYRANWSPTDVSHLESATGSWPKFESILRYLAACGMDVRLGLVIGRATERGLQLDSAITVSDGREKVFEVLADRTASDSKY